MLLVLPGVSDKDRRLTNFMDRTHKHFEAKVLHRADGDGAYGLGGLENQL